VSENILVFLTDFKRAADRIVRKYPRFSDINRARSLTGAGRLDEIDLLSGPPKRPRKPLYPIISDGTVGRFRNAASSLVLRQIDDAFRAAGIPLGNSGASQFQGQRRTRFMDYIVSADKENPAQVSRLLITLAHMMTELGQQYRDSRTGELRERVRNLVRPRRHKCGRRSREYRYRPLRDSVSRSSPWHCRPGVRPQSRS
jgi:hypothetical protein